MHSRDQLSRTATSRTAAAAAAPSKEISKEQCKHIISQTVKLIKGFDDRILSVDTYAQQALDLDSLDGEIKDPSKLFQKQALYGTARYRGVLKVLISSFYFNNSAKALREDASLYTLFGYLLFLRIDELGWPMFEKFVLSQQAVKMHVFLEYCYDFKMLNKWIKEEWCKVLDDDFVEGVLFKAIEDHLESANDLMKRLAKIVFGSSGAETTSVENEKPKKKKFTVPEPFDIHKPKEPVVPEPIRIESRIRAKEVPESTYKNSLEKINARDEARRQKIREQIEKRHQSFKIPQFTENKADVEAMREAKRKAEEAEMAYKFKAKPAPKFAATATVRTNAALILRENKLIRDKQEKEAAVIKAYETELRDASEFYNWQTNARKDDEEQRLQLVDDRREDMKASNRRAREAMDNQEQNNADNATLQRADMKVAREKHEADLLADLKKRQAQADAVKAVQFEAPKQAAEKMHKERQERAANQAKEMAALRREREEKDRIEQEIRNDLIRQIRALERAPKNAFFIRDFDPTETSGYRLDCEMSLVELRERLKMNKQRALEEEQRKREELRQDKVKKQERLDSALTRAMKVHKMAEEQNKERKRLAKMGTEERKAAAKAKSAAETKNLVAKLRSRRAKKREEVENARVKNAAIAKARLLLGADKDARERRHMQEQLLGAEREARDRQNKAKREVAAYERIKARHSKQTVTYKKKMDREFRELEARRADQVSKAHKYITDQQFQEKRAKQQHFREHQSQVKGTRTKKRERAYKPKQYIRPSR